MHINSTFNVLLWCRVYWDHDERTEWQTMIYCSSEWCYNVRRSVAVDGVVLFDRLCSGPCDWHYEVALQFPPVMNLPVPIRNSYAPTNTRTLYIFMFSTYAKIDVLFLIFCEIFMFTAMVHVSRFFVSLSKAGRPYRGVTEQLPPCCPHLPPVVGWIILWCPTFGQRITNCITVAIIAFLLRDAMRKCGLCCSSRWYMKISTRL